MDINLPYGEDLGLLQNGDIAIVTGAEEVVQRIERHLLSNPRGFFNDSPLTPDLLGAPDWGIGLGRFVETAASQATIQEMETLISAGILSEPLVDNTFDPTITFERPNPQELDVTINFDMVTDEEVTVSFVLPPQLE